MKIFYHLLEIVQLKMGIHIYEFEGFSDSNEAKTSSSLKTWSMRRREMAACRANCSSRWSQGEIRCYKQGMNNDEEGLAPMYGTALWSEKSLPGEWFWHLLLSAGAPMRDKQPLSNSWPSLTLAWVLIEVRHMYHTCAANYNCFWEHLTNSSHPISL